MAREALWRCRHFQRAFSAGVPRPTPAVLTFAKYTQGIHAYLRITVRADQSLVKRRWDLVQGRWKQHISQGAEDSLDNPYIESCVDLGLNPSKPLIPGAKGTKAVVLKPCQVVAIA
ncbi:hypothetical protein ATEIFO6365_0009024800 [Aspergillus terreus]|uniref:Uncharacterized protein n=1 Tax=Aspergillus terreus TaxID=33178 RepID=A0A5M3Z7X7_ASPTE|nr:hypothetical protein ATETN484_0011024800 [Aspergillus terreus]GFF18885.1 hypothetical protein ATEIFO6365_0009024800 [Aspergillus terreus]